MSRRGVPEFFIRQTSPERLWVWRLVEEFERVPGQYLRKLVNTQGILEVRVQLANAAFRLLGFFAQPTVLVLPSGFANQTQKTPAQEIATAIRRRAEYWKQRA